MKKVLAMLLTLVMALSICVPAFAAPELPPMPEIDLGEIKGKVEAIVQQKIEEKIASTFVALDEHLSSNPIPLQEDYATEAEWKEAIKDWTNTLLVSKAMSHNAAKVGLRCAYNKGTLSDLEAQFTKRALQIYLDDMYTSNDIPKDKAAQELKKAQLLVELKIKKDQLAVTTDPSDQYMLEIEIGDIENTLSIFDQLGTVESLSTTVTKDSRFNAEERDAVLNALSLLPTEDLPQVSKEQNVKDAITLSLENQAIINNAQYDEIFRIIDTLPAVSVVSIDVEQPIYDLVFATDGEQVYKSLTEIKIPTPLMSKVIDLLAERKILLDTQATAGKEAVNAHMQGGSGITPGTPEEEKPGSGIQSLLDKLFGKKDNTTDGNVNNSENGMKDPTGDVAIFSVLGLAAAAGTALVITKKKKSSK